MCAREPHAIIPLVHLPGLDRISRQRPGRVIAGVCAGLARGLALDVSVVRLGMLLLSLAGGFGVLVYGGLWLALPVDDDPAPARPVHRVDDVAALAVVLGVMLVLRAAGVWVTDAVAIVGGIAAVGVVLVWGRSGGTESPARSPTAAVRIAVGVALVIVGFVAFNVLTGDLAALGRSVIGAALAAVGIALLFGPRLARLASDLTAERRARIRSEEKAEIAAHLHDGVLQTLALIQHRAGTNREVAALARRQERELREWLYGSPSSGVTTLSSALTRELAAVEDDQQVPIELVIVGDAPLDEPARAMVAAVREAATNATRHAGGVRVDVYVEVDDDALTGYVRDRGAGFDPAAVPADRRGLADSVIGRMRRAGGTAVVRSQPGEGTEVSVSVPRRRS
jgi:signal transduction histidine kinase/phage shock protein PspC (stress-responsive transcriptional regulator)